MYTREKLVNFKPPQRNDEVRIRNEDMIYKLRVHFSKVHKPPYKNRTLFDYFDIEKTQKIRRQDFLNQIKKADFKEVSINDLDTLFDFLDHNNSGIISVNEFRYYFYEREFLEAEVKESALTGALEDDLKQLFSKIDSDGSGYIETEEFITCLNLLGFIVTPEVIMMEFGNVDKDDNRKIDFDEFKHMMKTKLRKDLLKIDNRI
jgi:Ca2+-binding EF-hand superfamily protein